MFTWQCHHCNYWAAGTPQVVYKKIVSGQPEKVRTIFFLYDHMFILSHFMEN